MSDRFNQILERIAPMRRALIQHRVYNNIASLPALQNFMQQHVFAVWDFMSLLKALQQRMTCISVPWLPAHDSASARFVNEIVLAEETDVTLNGGYGSHFDLYRNAMLSASADVSQIDRFLELLHAGEAIDSALSKVDAPTGVSRFVSSTFEIIASDDLPAIASAFTFGREDLLPDVFQQIVARLNAHSSGALDNFQYYLERHIELDGDEHGPLAEKLMHSVCANDDANWDRAEAAAIRALSARLEMWDAMVVQ